MHLRKPTPTALCSELAGAAAALRAASTAYRTALLAGDLLGAIAARERQIEAEIALERARWSIEGDLP